MDKFEASKKVLDRKEARDRALERRARHVKSGKFVKWWMGRSLERRERRVESAEARLDQILNGPDLSTTMGEISQIALFVATRGPEALPYVHLSRTAQENPAPTPPPEAVE